MSIIQKIRDRAAWILIGAIAVALIAFIVQDAFVGKGRGLFSGNSTTLGEVNGKKIDLTEFSVKMKNLEDNYTAQGYPLDDYTRKQEQDRLWNQFVEDAVLQDEYDRLGIEVTDKEVGDILYGENPPQDLVRQFTDPKTGQYDASQAYQQIQAIKKQKSSPAYKSIFGEYIPALIQMRKREKYTTLIANSAYVPKWLIEKNNAENSQLSNINYVLVPYNTINDSTIKVTDAEIRDYVNDRKDAFRQDRAAGIEYVSFSAAPSKEDSASVYNYLENIKDSFARVSDEKIFLQQENSQTPYYESKIHRKEIKLPNFDSIVNTPVGQVYGPYIDQNNYVLAKMVGEAMWPDTVKVRHILIATVQQQANGQSYPVRTDDEAKRIADSVANAIKAGANFDTLCLKYSDDPGKMSNTGEFTGGVYDKVTTGRMTPAFNDFIFSNKTGAKGVVKTDFGYHYIEILSQKGLSPAYQIAYLSRPILASDLTITTAMGKAQQFAGESRDAQSFKANAAKQGLNIFNAADIKPMDYNIPGLNGNSRDLVQWMYRDASVGDVSEKPFMIGDAVIVPILTQSFKEGVKTPEMARPLVEYKIRNNKKADQIIKKAGKPASLEALASAMNQQTNTADSVNFSRQYVENVGQEPKLIGAAFDKQNQSAVSSPIVGEAGVFYIRITNLSAIANPAMDVKSQQQMLHQQQQVSVQRFLVQNLVNAADVTDNRYKFY